MNRPLIGVNCNLKPHEGENGRFHLEVAYTQAVYDSGGLPQMIPILPIKEIPYILNLYDGLVLTGGGGLLPHVKNMETLPGLYDQNPKRHEFDVALAREAAARKMPIIGLCRGHQTINEIKGGTVRNLEDKSHRQTEPGNKPKHIVTVEKDSILYYCVNNTEVMVNSFHSQVIDRLGTGLKATARSSEGYIESIEGTEDHFLMGVQFHPEFMMEAQTMANIYKKFIEAAFDYRAKKR